MHILLCGAPGVGKSTLIARLTAALDVPVGGFCTKKEPPGPDGLSPVYLHPASGERRYTDENRVGLCDRRIRARCPAVFDGPGIALLENAENAALIVMDELGVMERDAEAFQRRVLALLDGDAPVLAAVKDKDTPFLNEIRNHPKARCFRVTEENRDELYCEILPLLKAQI